MKDRLIELEFDKWLSKLDIAPYPVMFWDIPLFIQMSYIQKWLREDHKVHIEILFMPGDENFYRIITRKVLETFESKNFGYDNTYEEALEAGLKKALELIK